MRNQAFRAFLNRFLKPEWLAVLVVMSLILVFAVSGGLFAFLTGRAVGVVVEQGSVSGLAFIVLGILALAALRGVVGFFQTFLAGQAGLRVNRAVNRDLVAKLFDRHPQHFRREGVGTWVERVRGDTSVLTTATTQMAILGSEGLSTIVYFAVAAWQSWPLLALGLLAIFSVSAVLAQINRRINRASHLAREQNEVATRHLSDVFAGHETVKAHGAEAFETRRWDQQIRAVNLKLRSQVLSLASFQPAMEASVGLAFALVVGVGGAMVLAGQAELAAVFSFLIAFILAGQSFQRAQKVIANAQPVIASAERVMKLLDPADAPLFAGQTEGFDVAVKGAQVAFDDGGLNGIDLSFQGPGLLALVGPSGSGKSTLLRSMAGLVALDGGQVSLGELNPETMDATTRARTLGAVLQDGALFDGSVLFNVGYGEDQPDLERCRAVLEQAQAGHLADTLHIGGLSGGERQRVLLARALYRDSPFLLLDEASSALDALLEEQFAAVLKQLGQDRTVVLVTHHLKLAALADHIVVLDEGKIVEHGDATALAAQDGLFAQMMAAAQSAAPKGR